MATLPVREIVLYKSGIGFFVRAGQHTDDAITLTFRADEINDVLKSLAVFDQAGGQVVSIGYDTPMDDAHRRSLSSIHLSDSHSLRDLVRDLRGRDVTLHVELVPGEISAIRGRMLGVEVEHHEDGIERTVSISLLRENGDVAVCPWPALREVTLHDATAQADLSYVLETSAGDDPRRSVSVRLSPTADGVPHDLTVYYVAPSPSWRVSYRVVAGLDETGEAGKLIFQGWGLFDNRLDEDLEDVRVTLIAGQPIAFIYDLYASHIPQRPTVQDEARIAAAPVEFEGSLPLSDMSDQDNQFASLNFIDSRGMGGSSKRRKESAPLPRAATPMSAPAETKDAGEFFEYQVALPVSVRRGESALVPILQRELAYRRELLYNGSKHPNHPVAALRFSNTTGLTLERGPVTIIEDGGYRGDAIVPFSRDGADVYLAFAVELGVTITEQLERATETTGLHIRDSMLVYEQYIHQKVTYTIENRTPRAQTITLEAPIRTGYDLFRTPPPATETATERRWSVYVTERSRTTFTRHERQLIERQAQVDSLTHQNLVEYLQSGWLDRALHDKLKAILDLYAEIQTAQRESDRITDARKAAFARQEQYRGNLSALSNQGKEAVLRDRILASLTQSQDQLEALDVEEQRVQEQLKALSERLDGLIRAL